MNTSGAVRVFMLLVLVAVVCAFSQEWEVKNSGINASETLADISAPLANGIYISGNGGIYKSANNGESYVKVNTSTEMDKVHAVDANTVWGLANFSLIKTTNGGTSWSTKSIASWPDKNGICSADFNTLWIVAWEGAIWKTINGGDTWTNSRTNTGTEHFMGCAAVDANIVYVCGVTATTDAPVIYKTINGGTTWSKVFQGVNGSHGLERVLIINANITYAVGGAGIYKTSNGGVDWVKVYSGALHGIAQHSSGRIFVVGSDGKLVHSDNGTDWVVDNTATAKNLNDIAIVDNTGWIVGADGMVLRNAQLVPTYPMDQLLITRGSVGSPDTDVYTLDSDGNNAALLYNDSGQIEWPHWSTDRSKIVFSSNASSTGKAEIFIINSDGSSARQITATNPTYGNSNCLFRSDSKIWYVNSQTAGVSEFYEINYDGSGSKKLSNFQSQGKQVIQNDINVPNNRICYYKQNASNAPSGRLYVANLDFTGEQRLTTATVREDHPRISPDGGRIAYHSNDINNAHNLYIINFDGTGRTKLTNYTGNQRCDSPVWSADGVFIYFSYFDGSQYDICRIGADGTELQNLTHSTNLNEKIWDCRDLGPNMVLSLVKGGSGYGQIMVNGFLTELPYTGIYRYDAPIVLDAIPGNGSTFQGWGGDLSGSTNPVVFSMSTNKNIEVNFLTATANPPISLQGPDKTASGANYTLEVQVGSADSLVTNLKIITMEILYTNTAYIDYVSHELGPFLTGGSVQIFPEDANGKLSASVFKTSGGNSGFGVVVRFNFKTTMQAPEGGQITFSFKQIIAQNTDGAIVELRPISKTITIENGLSIWPGDADNNGGVNIFDINPIVAGYWGKTGPARTNASYTWAPQQCLPWSPAAATYVDCSGDGLINIFDINPIVINFNKSHSASKMIKDKSDISPLQVVSEPPLLWTVDKTTVQPGEEFWVSVVVGSAENPVNNLKILSMEINYEHTEYMDYMTYLPGTFLPGASCQVIPEDASGKLSASIFVTSGSSSGNGEVIRFKFKLLANSPVGQQSRFSTGTVMANAEDGSVITLLPNSVTINGLTQVQALVGEALHSFALHQNFPNPFNPETQIDFELPEKSTVCLEIYNIKGQQIVSKHFTAAAGIHHYLWKPTGESGVYFCRLVATSMQNTQQTYRSVIKMTLTR